MTAGDFSALDRVGLNLQAVLDLDALPAAMLAELRRHHDPACRYRQLILLGHGGKSLWAAVKAAGIRSPDPIDDFSVAAAEQWFAAHFAGNAHQIVYPGDAPLGLQALGKIAGWHHGSPFMVGINEAWGTWFAYRVVILADTALAPSRPLDSESPCVRCRDKICVASCPGGALDGGTFSLEKCISHRKTASSRCKATCIARISCPVGVDHRYADEQIEHTYSLSMKLIERRD